MLTTPFSTEARTLGSLISAPDGGLYLIYDGVRHGVEPATLQALGISEQSTSLVSQATLEAIPDGARIGIQNGTLIAGPDGVRYLLFAGLHAIPDETTFDAYGWAGYSRFGPTPVVTIDAGLFAALPQRAPIAPAVRANPNRFDWGYCTWWVAQRRTVTWLGNAIEWYANARAQGYAVGDTPVPGAILVRRSSTWDGYGHVAYVESVSGTSFTVSEMNVNGLGVLSTRTYDMASNPPSGMVGFVYWRYDDTPAPTDDTVESAADFPGIVP